MSIADRIQAQALRGTAYNPGVPGPFAALLVSQSKHETGDYTSHLFNAFNNAFGYSFYAGSLYQTGAGTNADNGAPIAAYANVEDSTKEMVDYAYRRVRKGEWPTLDKITTPEQYAVLLKKVDYFQAPINEYLAGLKRFFLPYAAAVGSGLIIAGMLLLYLYRDKIF